MSTHKIFPDVLAANFETYASIASRHIKKGSENTSHMNLTNPLDYKTDISYI